LRICSRDMRITSLQELPIANFQMPIEESGEDRNRTYLDRLGSTAILKIARATRHPSLSGKRRNFLGKQERRNGRHHHLMFRDVKQDRETRENSAPRSFSCVPAFLGDSQAFVFLICLTSASKSGHSPVASLEWSSFPLALTSKAPPLEGTSVRDAIRSPSSRILAAKLTALGA
jgi:hypothetical protein